MAKDRFGEIRIDKGSPSPEDRPDVPLPQDDRESIGEETSPVTVVHDPPETYHSRRSPSLFSGIKLPVPSKKTVGWLLAIPLAVVLYGVASYFLVPASIKGILVPQLSREIDRPIDVGRIIFSPFNLELLVDDVKVGPIFGDVSGKDFLVAENGRFLFSLREIFHGHLVCTKAAVDILSMNIIRGKDSSMNLNTLATIFQSDTSDGQEGFLPSWLIIDEVEINADQLVINDQVTDKEFNLEQVYFYLPAAGARYHDASAVPKLSAVIDSSPFEINAIRIKSQTGAWTTGFSFEFRSVLLQRFRELLPFPESGLELSDGEADMVVDFILPEIQEGSEGIVVEGETSLKNIQWYDPESGALFKLPEGKVIYRIVPSEKLYRFERVEFLGLEIVVQENKDMSPQAYLLSVIQKIFHAGETLEVGSFQVTNGKVILKDESRSGRTAMIEDISISLDNFTTAGLNNVESSLPSTSKYTFSAKDSNSKPVTEFLADGELTANARLNGQLKISGLDIQRYTAFLPSMELNLEKGKADFTIRYDYGGRAGVSKESQEEQNKIYDGSFTINDFVVSRDKKKAIAGSSLVCKNFHFDTGNRVIFCNHLDVAKANIDTDSILVAKGTDQQASNAIWRFSTANLSLVNSTLNIPLRLPEQEKKISTKSSMIIKKVQLGISEIHSENVTDNVKMSGTVGKEGHIKINGSYSRPTGQGNLQLGIDHMDLAILKPYYVSWFVPTIKKGFLSAAGSLQLPEKTFKGSAWIDSLDAVGEGGSKILWKRLRADKLSCTVEPIEFQAGDLILQEPRVEPGLSSGDTPFANFLSLKEEKIPSTIQVGKVHIEDGIVDLPEPVLFPGYQPRVTDISGTVSFANAEQQSFMVNGQIDEQGSFTVYGTGSMKGLLMYELEMKDFSLLPFDSILRKDIGFSGKGVLASWKQKKGILENQEVSETNLSLHNVVPGDSGPALAALSMLIDADRKLEMHIADESSGEGSSSFLLEEFINRLRHLGVKATISPELVLKSTLPSIDVPLQVMFKKGETQLDGAESLFSYQELFQRRPFFILNIKGSYDPSADREVMRVKLQREEDQKREIENKRRALEKVRILQEEQRRRKELESARNAGVVEEVIPGYSNRDLEQLPPVKVVIPKSQLQELAKKRARTVYDYLVNQLRLDPSRVILDKNIAQGKAVVSLQILPYHPPGI